jgi:hypothetical protein
MHDHNTVTTTVGTSADLPIVMETAALLSDLQARA